MGLLSHSILDRARDLATEIAVLPEEERIDLLNTVRKLLHEVSPMRHHPVDLVLWENAQDVVGNPYNPNKVAPPEMRLLTTSIIADGYTQPIVASREGQNIVVVDGFHRHRVGKEDKSVRRSTMGRLPVVAIRAQQANVEARMASTIRHNRARGRHGVDQMSEIVAELAKKGWDDARISKELGMDADEVLRLKQITGLAALFADREFSNAWDIDEDALGRGGVDDQGV